MWMPDRSAGARNAVLALALGGVLAAAPAATAADPPAATPAPAALATTTTIDAYPNPVTEGGTIRLTARVGPNPGGGEVAWTVPAANDWTIGLTPVDPVTGTATLEEELQLGVYGLVATFGGSEGYAPSASEPLLVGVVRAGEPVSIGLEASTTTTEAGLPVELTATLSPAPEGWGEVGFFDGITLLGTDVADEDGAAGITASRLAVGTHRFVVAFLGDEEAAGAMSAPLEVVVTPPTSIHASGLGASPSTFYPVRDGYRDTVQIRGTVGQPATVRATVLSEATGKAVRSLGLGQKIGTYRATWNGRDAAGRLLPAGRYRIVQHLRDAWGNSLSHSNVVVLSRKRLHWTTASVTRSGASADSREVDGSALILASRFPGGLQVDAGAGQYSDWSSALVEYAFRLPAAAVYRTLTCGVLGVTDPGRGGASVALRDWRTRRWDEIEETHAGYGWTNAKVDADGYVSPTRKVACAVGADGWADEQVDIRTVKLTYTYAVLR